MRTHAFLMMSSLLEWRSRSFAIWPWQTLAPVSFYLGGADLRNKVLLSCLSACLKLCTSWKCQIMAMMLCSRQHAKPVAAAGEAAQEGGQHSITRVTSQEWIRREKSVLAYLCPSLES
jgi:hypothetical protein